MKIKSIAIKDFRGIEETSFHLSDQLNVFAGINGSGKSSILDAIAISLSWLVNRIQRENATGKSITDDHIKNGAPFASLILTVVERRKEYAWSIVKTRKGAKVLEKSDLTALSTLAAYYQKTLHEKSILPVVAYYPINRVVNITATEARSKDAMNSLDVYENALGGKTNYASFFEWFRMQDDIVNENAQSRIKWMLKNKTWVKRRANKLLESLKEIKINNKQSKRFLDSRIERLTEEEFLYEEPRILFFQIEDLLHILPDVRPDGMMEVLVDDITSLLDTMGVLSEAGRNNVIDYNRFPAAAIERVMQRMMEISEEKELGKENTAILLAIWEVFTFAILLSLWWISDKSKREIEMLFTRFHPLVNKGAKQNGTARFINELEQLVTGDAGKSGKVNKDEGRELSFVTAAIENFVPGYANLRITRLPKPRMLVDKNGETIDLDQLSDGEKNLIALVGDIARRLSIANANSAKPLHGNGIILIDELDLHLHPAWQRLMIPNLLKLFPNCQFLVTTHSPQVISHAKPDHVFLLNNNQDGFAYTKAMESYGKNSDRILEDLLGVDSRPTREKKMLHDLFRMIQNNELDAAKQEVKALIALIGEDPELIKAEGLIKRKEIIGK